MERVRNESARPELEMSAVYMKLKFGSGFWRFQSFGGVRITQGVPLESPETIMDVGLGSGRMQGWKSESECLGGHNHKS